MALQSSEEFNQTPARFALLFKRRRSFRVKKKGEIHEVNLQPSDWMFLTSRGTSDQ